jgi:GLPGLI family protein
MTLRKTLNFAFLLLSGLFCAQQGKAVYLYNYQPEKLSQEQEEKLKEEEGKHSGAVASAMAQAKAFATSKSSSKFIVKFNETMHWGAPIVKAEFRNMSEFNLLCYGEFYNYPKENLIFQTKYFIGDYVLKHSYAELKWQITDETKQIGPYKCTKAIGESRSQVNHKGKKNNVEAWFTEDLSYNIAPWHYQGLPGTVVMAKEAEHSFLLEKIEEIPVSINDNVKKEKAINLDQYIKATQ